MRTQRALALVSTWPVAWLGENVVGLQPIHYRHRNDFTLTRALRARPPEVPEKAP